MLSRRLLLTALCLVVACASPPRRITASGVVEAESFIGFWATDGYGAQLEITSGGDLIKSQITSISCIPGSRARLLRREADALAYQRTDGPITVRVRRGTSHDEIRVRQSGASSDIVARRIPGPLPVCDHAIPDTPRSAFEVFAATWAESYPFFDLHHVDWAKVVDATRPKVTAETTPDALFEILKGMIAPLHDAHAFIQAPTLHGDGIGWAGFRAAPGAIEENQFARAETIANKYLVAPPRRLCADQIEVGMLDGEVAYLRIRSFNDYAGADGSFERGLAVLESALDIVFAGASRWRGLVIDVRINGGGYDAYGVAIAARLTGAGYVAYAKQARLDPRDATMWTPLQPIVVRPSARPRFLGRVVELTGPLTVSAGETSTMAPFGRVPGVVRVGQNTQGVFSDVMLRSLPNGWVIGLPNERYVTNGKSYDGDGIPSTISVPVYTPADLESGRDPSLEEALRLVRGA